MVKSCAVFNCTQRYERGISFHQFPGDTALLKQWLIVMKQEDWTPTKFSLICSRHFTEDCYEKKGWSSQRKLKANAVPSIFTFSENLDMKKRLRPRAHEKSMPENASAKSSTKDRNDCQAQGNKQIKKRKGRVSKKNDPQVKYSNSLKGTHKNEIKLLEENNKLLKQKLSNLKALVKYLKAKSQTVESVSKGPKRRRNR